VSILLNILGINKLDHVSIVIDYESKLVKNDDCVHILKLGATNGANTLDY
jgi:hypothetical protein